MMKERGGGLHSQPWRCLLSEGDFVKVLLRDGKLRHGRKEETKRKGGPFFCAHIGGGWKSRPFRLANEYRQV